MRLREIINLRRNCIVNKEFGNIKYYSKTSGGNLIDAFLTRIKHHIYLRPSSKNPDKISRFGKEFSKRFSDIVKELEGSLSNGIYTAYCLRDTFINSIYEEGVKVNLSILELSSITGNSYRIAVGNYRKKTELIHHTCQILVMFLGL